MAKNHLRDKLTDNELDLSMMNLTEVPVKEIAALPKATKIDLSNNQLTTLPSSFAQSLGNITHLELGSNKLKEIPDNFFKLQNLKHLDLYNNQLANLPVSFCQLRSLKWLDLKGNPLNAKLRKIAGDCLNQRECEAAARNIVGHLKKLQTQMENEKQEKLRKEKEKEESRARAEEEKLAKKRAEKKAAREKRKAEQRALLQTKKPEVNGTVSVEKQYSAVPKPTSPRKQKKAKSGVMWQGNRWSLLGWINLILLVCLVGTTGVAVHVYTDGDFSSSGVAAALPRVVENANVLARLMTEAVRFENLKQIAQTLGTTVAEAASAAWAALQQQTGDLSIYTDPVIESVTTGWIWLKVNTLFCYEWIVNNVDWEAILLAIKSSLTFLYEQWLVLCEELRKNEALMSVVATVGTHTAGVLKFLGEVWSVAWVRLSFIVEYVQEEGPDILAAVKEQAASALHSAKQSIEGLVK
ncbi:uncharacterized protein [Panulirus ornatus]|uniref:uncharacterized protein isoform X2 n=1 Tax=Panulirus ornatus TaxID=150431 RepID=UPI003A854343